MDKDFSALFSLTYKGKDADEHQIDFYDITKALEGLHRSLSLTTHLVLNGKIITQPTALKGAKIRCAPPEKGSWKILATVSTALTGAYLVSTAPRDTPPGHLVYSVYDYVVRKATGVPVDYNKSLFEHYKKDYPELHIPDESQLDTLVEKCHDSIVVIHCPIIQSESAESVVLSYETEDGVEQVGEKLDHKTYKNIIGSAPYGNKIYRMSAQERMVDKNLICSIGIANGNITSYDLSTGKGKICIASERHQIVNFQLVNKTVEASKLIAENLSENAKRDQDEKKQIIYFEAHEYRNSAGKLKKYEVLRVSSDKESLATIEA